MNKRATSWLLAALMALCVTQAVPSGSVQRVRETCPIVWMARARVEQRVALRKSGRYSRTHIVVALPYAAHAHSSLVEKSLYQRPPPPFLA